MSRFLHWVETEAPKGGRRRAQGGGPSARPCAAKTASFATCRSTRISGAGPNGAIVHYRSSEKTNRRSRPARSTWSISGGQYLDGTTDITRTVAIGEPTAEMRDRFTRVLKGHIAVATAVFPKGTRGSQLDSFARRPLWEAGLDYAHGTGHGVGSFLSVHEGPQRISPVGSAQAGGDEPLQAGMILSNEPGYYKTGEYGIRIENLVLVVDKPVAGAEKEMLGFETLTFAPIERRLIDVSMLSDAELDWLDDYHARGAGEDRPAAGGGRQGLARKAVRAAKPLGWMALGGAITAILMLGPRVAVNRALDAGYSLAGWVRSSSAEPPNPAPAPFAAQILAQRGGQPFALFLVMLMGLTLDSGKLTRRAAIGARSSGQCCRSSVVERILGKAEVVSSILTGSTIPSH